MIKYMKGRKLEIIRDNRGAGCYPFLPLPLILRFYFIEKWYRLTDW